MSLVDHPRAGARPGKARADRRGEILEALRAAQAALDVRQLSDRVGLHPNTVRFHLDRLVADGSVSRRVEARTTPGRPRVLFAATDTGGGDGSEYLVLARLLTEHLADARDPSAVAERAGRAFGAQLAAGSAALEGSPPETATSRVVGVFADLGFRPELVPDGERQRMLLRRCPFRELARSRPEVVCSVHLGLLRGALEATHAPLAAEALEPFVEPSLCVAHLARTVG